jgi:cation diffusion facilitator family transporter
LARLQQHQKISLVLAITLVGNIVIAAIKLYYGLQFNLVSLEADGFHTGFDALSNVIGLVAIRIAHKPPDPEHPYGHWKIKGATSIVIGLFITVGLMEVGRGIWGSISAQTEPTISGLTYIVIFGTMVANLAIGGLEYIAGKSLKSPILKSDSMHTLSDGIAELGVLGGVVLVDYGWPGGDIAAAAFVLLFIGVTAYRVLSEGWDVIIDSSTLEAEDVCEVALDVPEVRSCHYVRSRGHYGHIHLDLHISLDGELSISEGGKIMRTVQERLRDTFDGIEDITIQVEPHEAEYIEDAPEQLI